MIEFPTLYTKEKATLEFIKEYLVDNRVAPSLEEIRTYFGKKSLATVHKSVKQLEDKGFLQRNKHHGRSIALTDMALEYFGLKPLHSLPLAGIVKAGPGGVQNFSDVKDYVEVPGSTFQDGRYVLKVEGESMIDAFINEDDYVVVEKVQDIPINQIVIALLNEQAYIKRLIRRSDGQIILRSENPDYDDIFLQETDEFKIEGKVVQVIRNYG
ncbi:repressor LexA [candidate division KSB3 bacterium]|uniref:Repressor LexA n=1 Tax=candidate division KSB3 bacterium TaxID=2044937 RepID=A0A9D5JTU1_9BACT|nr:repressor LexA [candidate division KSB3 bacterium]MBD3324123.1 repressor LexA [candidate division KSB3 bacterium]